jgi:hypothetical protein
MSAEFHWKESNAHRVVAILNSQYVKDGKGKGKAVPLQVWTGPEAPRFQDNRHLKVVRLSALGTGRVYPPGNIPGTHFC